MLIITKKCYDCGQEKDLSQFNADNSKFDRKCIRCKDCSRAHDRARYKKHKETIQERNDRYRQSQYMKMWQYLMDHPCVDCGETNIVVLEFDHRDPTQKEFTISALVRCSWERVFREIQKCDVVCCNCHNIRTARQKGWAKLAFYESLTK